MRWRRCARSRRSPSSNSRRPTSCVILSSRASSAPMMRETASGRRPKMIRLERNSRDVGRRGCADMPAKAIDRRIAIDISERSADWRAVLRRRRAICNSAARAALAAAPFGWMAGSAGLELCIVLGDDPLLRRLNRQWRGQDRPTNVLSFAAQDPARISAVAPPQRGARRSDALLPLGDVVLAFGTIAGEAASQGKTLADDLLPP